MKMMINKDEQKWPQGLATGSIFYFMVNVFSSKGNSCLKIKKTQSMLYIFSEENVYLKGPRLRID